MEAWNELAALLQTWLNRLRRLRAARWSLAGLTVGLAVALAGGLALVLSHQLLAAELAALAAGLSLLGAAAGAGAGLLVRLDKTLQARRIDRLFGLKERVSTALELHAEPAVPDEWRQRQLADSLAAARLVDAPALLPLRFDRRFIAAALVLTAALAGLIFGGRSIFQETQQQRQVEAAIQDREEQVQAILQEIQEDETLTAEQIQALTEPLQEALRRLQAAETPEEALSALSEAEQQLQAMNDPAAGLQLQALQELGSQLLSAIPNSESALNETAQALAEGDLAAAAESLSELDPEQLTPEEQQALAEALQQAASQLAQTNPALAQSLQNAAGALQQGQLTPAQAQALQQLAGQLAQAGQENAQGTAAQAAAAQAAAAQLQQSQQALAQALAMAQQSGTGSAGANGQNGQGGQGSTTGPGTGSSNANNNSGDGSGGAGRGEGGGDAGTGSETGQNPIDSNNGPGDGGEKPFESIYAPEHLGGDPEQGLDLPGSGEPGDQVLGQQPSAPGTEGQSQVPYVDVLPAYTEAFRRAIENGQAPSYLLPVIRDYFSGLEP